MTTPPLVSVVIPCFNQSQYLRGALQSVHAQDWPAIESIVVDDGSTDETSAVARAHGATIVVRQDNYGISAARNAGLRAAHGEYIVFLDADDELMPDAVRSGVEVLRRNQGVAGVGRRCLPMDADGHPLPVTYPVLRSSTLYEQLLSDNLVWTPGAALFRRDSIRALGGFPLEHSPAADYAVLLALARCGQLIIDPRDVVRYRKHDSNMSHDPMLMLRATLGTLRRERRFMPREYKAQLAAGRRRWRQFYGEQLTMVLRREWRTSRRAGPLMRGTWFLCWHCPRQAARHFVRKLLRVVRQMPSTDLDPPLSPTSNAAV
ncbi:MAG TPA: glycosyltransferase [Vicinamibacterales bacterium]|nr:glycosyltransferase [Vicinamibacterales bacterium]